MALQKSLLRALTIHFFVTRHLKKHNKRTGIQLNSGDIRVLFYLQLFGPIPVGRFEKLNGRKILVTAMLPKLINAGFVEKQGRKYACTFAGEMHLRRYAEMLYKARMDRITLAEKKKTTPKRNEPKSQILETRS